MTLEIVPVEEMPFKEGETLPGQNSIRIREDVYIAACHGEGRARFTVAHEIGHFMLHTRFYCSLPYGKRAEAKAL